MLQFSKTRIFSVAAALLMALVASSAQAQGTAEQRSACMGDAFRFCSAYIPNVSAIERCLQNHVNTLSPACRSEFRPDGGTNLRAQHFQQR